MDNNLKKLINGLSINEKKILPNLQEKELNKICKKTNLNKVSVVRALKYLENKKLVKLSSKKKKIVEIGVNGAFYRKKGLPERRLLNLLGEKRILILSTAQKESKLTPDEFKASLGALKKKAKNMLKKLNRTMWGQEKLKIIIEDPSGNSAIISDKAKKSKL